MTSTRSWAGLVALAMGTAPAAGQTVGWDDPRWRFEAAEARLDDRGGTEALVLRGGTAWLDRPIPADATIEFELEASSALGFYGLAFRARDGENYEHIYVRPFMSGNPDATQYTPVYRGVTGWQLYSSPRFASPASIATDRWVRVRIAFAGDRAELTIDGDTVRFPELLRPVRAGILGLTSTGAPARFANLVITPGSPDLPTRDDAPRREVPPGVVRTWRVSSTFPEARLAGDDELDPGAWHDLRWDRLDADPGGIANLAMIRRRTAERNTAIAAVTLRAAEAGPVAVRFGFSDRVVALLNGRPIYRGRAEWRSRDYRFLGTVGLFDELILPLNPGPNELWLAVSEDFGGWGVTVQVLAGQDVEVVEPAR